MPGIVHLINGPNLNLLGQRQPEIYGHDTLEDVLRRCDVLAEELGLTVAAFQSNHEGAIVDAIQAARGVAGGSSFSVGKRSPLIKASSSSPVMPSGLAAQARHCRRAGMGER